MIRHTVSFRLGHAVGTPEAENFFMNAERLARIPGVTQFEILTQISEKSEFTHALSMEFADAAAYAGYNEHPDHLRFVTDIWLPEVEKAQELDYELFRS
jgi:Stress responsive A/B Barrel Domain